MKLIKYFNEYINLINEGLIKTHDPELVLNTTLHKLIDFDINGKLIKSHGNFKISISVNYVNKLTFENFKLILDIITQNLVNFGGYFVSIIKATSIHNQVNNIKGDIYQLLPNIKYYNCLEFIFESKFDKIENDIPEKLYHLTIKEYLDKILKNGLIPKSSSKLTSHSDRIYVCKTIEDCENLKIQMKLHYSMELDKMMYGLNKKDYKKDTDMIIVEIDNSDDFIKTLYVDPNYKDGYFIVENIPPNKIKVL